MLLDSIFSVIILVQTLPVLHYKEVVQGMERTHHKNQMPQSTYQGSNRYKTTTDSQKRNNGRSCMSLTPWRPWDQANPMVVAFNATRSDHSFETEMKFTDSGQLDSHFVELQQQQEISNTGDTSRRSVYILEGLSSDFTKVFAKHLSIHASVFQDHERLVPLENRETGEAGGIPFLPSAIHARDHVSLKYHEPILFSKAPQSFRNLCNTSGRHLAATRLQNVFSAVVIARRKCTVWLKTTSPSCWDCELYLLATKYLVVTENLRIF